MRAFLVIPVAALSALCLYLQWQARQGDTFSDGPADPEISPHVEGIIIENAAGAMWIMDETTVFDDGQHSVIFGEHTAAEGAK